ncbi:MAG: S8 family serine peptidase, partial [Candidatus Hodarchaeales archaeon]
IIFVISVVAVVNINAAIIPSTDRWTTTDRLMKSAEQIDSTTESQIVNSEIPEILTTRNNLDTVPVDLFNPDSKQFPNQEPRPTEIDYSNVNYPDVPKYSEELPQNLVYWRDIDFDSPVLTSFNKYDNWLVKSDGAIEFIVRFDDISYFTDDSELSIFLTQKGCTVLQTNPSFHAILIKIPVSGSISDLLQEVEAFPEVRYAEPNSYMKAAYIPNDPYWSDQWGPQIIEADDAWDTQDGDIDILVAIIDTGIDYDHEDLANYVPGGYDFINDDNDPMDDEGHGTHCAGTVAATINNGIGIAGVANVSIAAVKGLDEFGYGSDFSLASSVYWAVDELDADILSNSWGGFSYSETIHEAFIYAHSMGKISFAAAGNLPVMDPFYPAGLDEVIAVTATNALDEYAGWAGYGDWVELCAPGEDIISTIPDNEYGYGGGTSMSTPHVAGVAALAWSEFPGMTNEELRTYLQLTAEDLGAPGFDIYTGFGRVSAKRAVEGLPPHDLKAMVQIDPEVSAPGIPVDITAIAMNVGTTDEYDVVIHLEMDGTEIWSDTIPYLAANGGFYSYIYQWTPGAIGSYEFTCYVESVPGETDIDNNMQYRFAQVINGLQAEAGDYIDFKLADYDDYLLNWFNYTYTSDVYDYMIDVVSEPAELVEIYQTINTLTGEIIESSEPAQIGLYYTMQRDPLTFYPGATFNWWSATGTVIGETTYLYKDQVRDVWIVEVFGGNAITYYDKEYGVWLYYYNYGAPEMGYIIDTNIIPDIKYPHELKAILAAPNILNLGDSALIEATVKNIGLNDEYDVDLQLWVEDTLVANYIYPVLPVDASETLYHLWEPTVEGIYNIIAYVVPVPNEQIIENNEDSKLVLVAPVASVAILQDVNPWGLTSTMDILQMYGRTYAIITSNMFGTVDLSVYEKVIISSDQTQNFYDVLDMYLWWLEDYVANGGTLEIHAADSGWNYGIWSGPLPGGSEFVQLYAENVDIIDPIHPLVNDPWYITDEELDWWSSSTHGYLENIGEAQVILADGSNPVCIEQWFGSGRIIISTQTLEWGYYFGYSPILENFVLYFPEIPTWDYDIIVDLDSPSSLLPGMDTILTGYVYNTGPEDAYNVELQLWIDGVLVAGSIYPTLAAGDIGMLYYPWLPPGEGTYEITVYTIPLEGDPDLENNIMTKQVVVGLPIIDFELGDFITIFATEDDYMAFEFIYVEYITPTNVFMETGYGGWIIVDTVTRIVLDSNMGWVDAYYLGQIETDIDVGDTINWFYVTGEVIGTEYYNWYGCILETWVVYLHDWDQYLLFHKETGVWLAYYYSYPDGIYLYMQDTSMIEWVLPEHELSLVGLEMPWLLEPGEKGTISVAVSNNGLSDETNVEIQIWCGQVLETTLIIPFIASLTVETTTYEWTAPSVENTYEILVYVVPVPGENYLYDNYAWDWPIVNRYTFVTDFESYLEGLETDGLWHLVDDSQPYGEVYSPTHSMWYGQDDTGDYDTGTANSDALTTPYILLEDAQAFTFFSWYETEEPGHFYDLKDVYIILPDGSWEMLGYVSGVMNEWVWYSFDISAYNGLLVRFAFFFDTVDNILNNFRGWYIDDIIIFGEAHVKKFHDLEAMITVP